MAPFQRKNMPKSKIKRYAEEALHFEAREKRDQFAAAALMGMIASTPVIDRTLVDKDKWADVAFEFANAMLARSEWV
jgi:hypothetical protein